MYAFYYPPLPRTFLYLPRNLSQRSFLFSKNKATQSIPTCRFSYGDEFYNLLSSPQVFAPIFNNFNKRKRNRITLSKANRREAPHEVLGVSSSATTDEIKRAYRKLALKFHPDVNKEPNAKEKFMRIKHAYNTLLNSESRRRYDAGKSSGFSYSGSGTSQSRNSQEEEFYGLGDFFRDLQEEFQNWEASASSQGKPKSLWEELAEIGEEFVEFLEKELNITATEPEANDFGSQKDDIFGDSGAKRAGNDVPNEDGRSSSIKDNIDEIEATLAKLKKELGL